MFALACPTSSFPAPTGWEQLAEHVRSASAWAQVGGVLLVAVGFVGLICVGLFAQPTSAERWLCGAAPLLVAFALFAWSYTPFELPLRRYDVSQSELARSFSALLIGVALLVLGKAYLELPSRRRQRT